jgi:hypothetical protein
MIYPLDPISTMIYPLDHTHQVLQLLVAPAAQAQRRVGEVHGEESLREEELDAHDRPGLEKGKQYGGGGAEGEGEGAKGEGAEGGGAEGDLLPTVSLTFSHFIGGEGRSLERSRGRPEAVGPAGQLHKPQGVAIRCMGQRETVLVAEATGDGRVSEFDLNTAELIRTFGEGKLLTPDGITYLENTDEVAVADLNHQVSIFKYDTGEFVRSFGSRGKVNGQFDYPTALVSDAYGNCVVLDQGTSRMQLFNSDGDHLLTRTDLGLSGQSVRGIAWGAEEDGCLAVANGHGNYARAWWRGD